MSDRIKKIKIKQSDGTFSDYIPIGADAKDIDFKHNGNNVENTLKKKPYYYDNIEKMKLDDSLQIGDMAITLGYHKPNDGGSGIYKIIDDSSLEDNGGSIHNLNSGLKAQLIIKDGQINIKQFGAYGDKEHDDTLAIQNAINFNYNNSFAYQINFPSGNYIINNINVRKYSNIKGNGWGNTFFTIKDNCDTYGFGITESDAYFINLSNFTIIGNKDNNTCKNGIYISRKTISNDPIEKPRVARDLWLTIEQVRVTGVYGNGIGTDNSDNNFRESRFNNIDVNNCGGYGLYLFGSDNNYFQITSWGNTLDGFLISGSAERYSCCKSFANGDDNHISNGFTIRGDGHQIIQCEAQENYGHGFNIDGSPNANYIIRSDANGKIEKNTGSYTYAGVNFVNEKMNQRINMILTCNDFIASGGGENSQGYGLIFGDLQQCNIFATCYAQGTANYIINKDYILKSNNNIIINGNQITYARLASIALENDIEEKEHILFGKSKGIRYDLFKNHLNEFRIDNYYNNQYINNPFYFKYIPDTQKSELKLLGNNDKIGFFGKTPISKQNISSEATDLDSTLILINDIRTILINYGLVNSTEVIN